MIPETYTTPAKRLTRTLEVNEEEAYAMMLLEATLMDLRPEDDRVVETILQNGLIN